MDDSVVLGIVTRNRAGLLKKAVQSAIAQKGVHVRIVVIDDGSTDETPDLPASFPDVTWIRREKSGGYISARNELMAMEDCNYFASLDDDAWFVGDDEIALAMNFLNENHAVAAVGFDILSPDHPEPKQRSDPQPIATFIGCGHVLRLSAIRQVGCYELTPGSYGSEEKDLCLRLMDAGHQVVRLPGVHVWHDKSLAARDAILQHQSAICNDLVMTLRRTPALILPIALLTKIYRHSKFSFRHGLMRPCLQGFGVFFRSIPAVLRTRRPVHTATLRAFVRLARASRD